MRRRSLALGFLGAALGSLLVLRRKRDAGPTVSVHYDDGSVLTLDPSRPEGERLVAAAERALTAVHSLSP